MIKRIDGPRKTGLIYLRIFAELSQISMVDYNNQPKTLGDIHGSVTSIVIDVFERYRSSKTLWYPKVSEVKPDMDGHPYFKVSFEHVDSGDFTLCYFQDDKYTLKP